MGTDFVRMIDIKQREIAELDGRRVVAQDDAEEAQRRIKQREREQRRHGTSSDKYKAAAREIELCKRLLPIPGAVQSKIDQLQAEVARISSKDFQKLVVDAEAATEKAFAAAQSQAGKFLDAWQAFEDATARVRGLTGAPAAHGEPALAKAAGIIRTRATTPAPQPVPPAPKFDTRKRTEVCSNPHCGCGVLVHKGASWARCEKCGKPTTQKLLG